MVRIRSERIACPGPAEHGYERVSKDRVGWRGRMIDRGLVAAADGRYAEATGSMGGSGSNYRHERSVEGLRVSVRFVR
jgi:hypothetical protein